MLRWRLILGPLIVAALAGLCWLDWRAVRPGTYLLPLALVASILAANELLAMFGRLGGRAKPLPWVVHGGVVLTVLVAAAPIVLPTTSTGGTAVG